MPDAPRFDSAEELAALMEAIGLALHGKNRMGLGEQHFAWELAQVIRACGVVAGAHLTDSRTQAEFGDAYAKGSLPDRERRATLLAMIGQAMDALD